MTIRIHPTAEVSPHAIIGEDTSIWNHAQVREGAQIGRNCLLSKGVCIDFGVQIGDNVNDRRPRAINPDGSPESADDWLLTPTLVRTGACIGAHATKTGRPRHDSPLTGAKNACPNPL